MDVHKYLHELYLEKKSLDRAIAALEAKLRGDGARPTRRRGRKSMSAEERLEVSRRMASYWAAKRAASRSSTEKEKSSGTPAPMPPEHAVEPAATAAATA